VTEAIVHIGVHKTGTTSIQAFLRDHERELHAAGWHFPNGWLQLNCHFELGLAMLNRDRLTPSRTRGGDWHDSAWRRDVVHQVRRELERRDERLIISCEELSLFRFREELASLRMLVDDATIVIYLREPARWLESQRDELTKPTNVGLSNDRGAFNYLEQDSWLVDYDARIEGFARFFEDVRVLDYDAELEADGSIIPSFCRQLGIEVPRSAGGYWLNTRGTINDGRVPGTRWCGGQFGDPVVPTSDWQDELFRRRDLTDAVARARNAKSPAARS
jgi:hypothetical protein